jgi:hypothetical protein
MMLEAIGKLLDAGRAAGAVTAEVDPSDILAAVTGIALSVGTPEQRDRANRLISLTVAGLGTSEQPGN